MADHSARIAEIDLILQSGAKSVGYDGTHTEYDFEALRQERRALAADDDTLKSRRPVAFNVKLGGSCP